MKKRQLLGLFGIAWGLMLLAFVAIAYWADQNTVSHHEMQFNDLQSKQVALARQGIEDSLQALSRRLARELYERYGASGNGGSDQFDRTARTLPLLSETILAGALVTRDGAQLTWARSSAIPTDAVHAALGTFSKRLLDSATETPSAATITPDFVLTPDYQLAAIAFPIGQDGSFDRRWFLAVLNLGSLFETYVGLLRFGEFGAGYVLDGDGRIAYDHEREIIGRSVFDGMHDAYPGLLDLDLRLVSEPTGVGEYSFTVERGGAVSRKLIAWDTAMFGSQRIIVALSKPDVEIHAALRAQRLTLVIGGGLLLIGFIGTTVVFLTLRQRLWTDTTATLSRLIDQRTVELDRELAARRESEHRFRDYAECSSDWFWETDENHRFTFVSDKHEEVTGITAEERLGRTRRDIAATDSETTDWSKHESDLAARRDIRDFCYTVISRMGRPKTVRINGRPVFDVNGTFRGYRGTATDITDQVVAQAALTDALERAEQANRAKSRFLAAMSHDLRTPLNAIIGFSDVLAQEYFGPIGSQTYRSYAQDIHSSAHLLLELVDALLDLSAIEAGRVPLEPEDLEAGPVIADCLQVMANKVQQARLEVITQVETDLPTIQADRRALKQILINILSNSAKFTPTGGTITVSAARDADGVRLSIADTGPGIPPDVLQTIQETFTRYDGDPYRTSTGWGLGLSIVDALVTRHGWTLDIASKIDVGTTVTIEIPTERPPAEALDSGIQDRARAAGSDTDANTDTDRRTA